MGQVESANVKSKTHRHLVTTLLPPPHIWCGMISSPTAPCIRQGRAAAQPPRCASTSLLPAGCWQWRATADATSEPARKSLPRCHPQSGRSSNGLPSPYARDRDDPPKATESLRGYRQLLEPGPAVASTNTKKFR